MSFLILLLCGTLSTAAIAAPQSAVVVVPVADVWSRPLAPSEKPTDDLRETQVLSGEKVLIHESSGTWALIEAVEQPTFRQHSKWEGYPGWVQSSSISMTNPFPDPSPNWMTKMIMSQRKPFPPEVRVLYSGKQLLKAPYLWGGLSPSGIDCSGLTHLSYRVNFRTIPRDAHEQWMKAKPIKRAELKPADLIFSAKADNPKKITHVALYAGDSQIIEAPQNGMVVRKISFQEKYGKELSGVESGDTVGERVIYFGSFLH